MSAPDTTPKEPFLDSRTRAAVPVPLPPARPIVPVDLNPPSPLSPRLVPVSTSDGGRLQFHTMPPPHQLFSLAQLDAAAMERAARAPQNLKQKQDIPHPLTPTIRCQLPKRMLYSCTKGRGGILGSHSISEEDWAARLVEYDTTIYTGLSIPYSGGEDGGGGEQSAPLSATTTSLLAKPRPPPASPETGDAAVDQSHRTALLVNTGESHRASPLSNDRSDTPPVVKQPRPLSSNRSSTAMTFENMSTPVVAADRNVSRSSTSAPPLEAAPALPNPPPRLMVLFREPTRPMRIFLMKAPPSLSPDLTSDRELPSLIQVSHQ